MLVSGKENMNNPKVSIVVLNWNGWEDTIECLESLYQITYPNYEVIVVDNDSKDDSIEKIKDYVKGKIKVESKFIEYESKKPIKVIEYTEEEVRNKKSKAELEIENLPPSEKLILIGNKKNYGFAEGNNMGIRYALQRNTDHILLLNNDTVVHKDFLTELVCIIESDSNIGMAGSKIYDYWKPNLIQSAGGKINWTLGEIKRYMHVEEHNQYNKAGERDFVWATSSLIKKEVFKKVGLLDPYFFFGVEEYDFCTRAKRAGFKIVYFPMSIIWHKQYASGKKLEEYPDIKKMILKQGGLCCYKHYHKLFKKHLPPFIYIFPFLAYMFRWLFGGSVLTLKYLFTRNIHRFKEGYRDFR